MDHPRRPGFLLQDKLRDCRHTGCREGARREDLPGCRQPTYDEALWGMWHPPGARSQRSRMSSLRSPPYSDSTTELPEYTGINNDPIDLVGNLLSYPPALRYSSSARKTEAFNYASEVSITRPSRTGTRYLELRLYPPDRSANSNWRSDVSSRASNG